MIYVIDSCVGVKCVLPEPHSDRALALQEGFRRGAHHLLAPDFYTVEGGHAILRAEKKGIVKPGDGEFLFAEYLSDLPVLRSAVPYARRAYEIAAAIRGSVYDCTYVAMAEAEGCGFVTADEKLINALQMHFSFLVPLASL